MPQSSGGRVLTSFSILIAFIILSFLATLLRRLPGMAELGDKTERPLVTWVLARCKFYHFHVIRIDSASTNVESVI